jgi:CIC family chloride channel protein
MKQHQQLEIPDLPPPASGKNYSKLLAKLRSFLIKAAPDQALWALAEASVIGTAAACASIMFTHGERTIDALHTSLAIYLPEWLAVIVLVTVGSLIAGLIVQFIAPEITGSGIPQVKAVLNAVPIPLNFRVALSKLIGSCISLGVGLPLGKEGPTVHIGAACGAILAKLVGESPRRTRQLIAAGAGAGLAAAFNAPLAGVMFVIEELLRDFSRATVSTAFFACFFAAVVARWIGNHSLDIPANSPFPHAQFATIDVPFCIFLGIVCGALGSYFNNGIIKSCELNKKFFGKNIAFRIALAGCFCGIVIALLPESFKNFTGVAKILFEQHSWRLPLVILLANFILSIVAYGSGVPGGLFAPSLTIGAATGYLIGLLEQYFFPQSMGCAVTLALAGMGAFFTGVARVPITATIIVFEITTDFNMLLPLMICSITAFLVGERIAPGSIYDRLLEMQGIHLPGTGSGAKIEFTQAAD